MKSSLYPCALIIGIALLVGGCSSKHLPATSAIAPPASNHNATLREAMNRINDRAAWETLPSLNVARYPGEIYLKGLTICIDPGHGGTDGGETTTRPAGYKSGPTGLKEAVINLRVGLLLERLLKDAGVNVIMTRHGDDTVSLEQRAEIANNAPRSDGTRGADLFVSIHHNASRPSSNYPSVWYHGSVDDNEPSLDVARHIALQLGEQMHTQVGITSPIFSSQLMYPSGFAVLRQAKMPAVLCECSFMTHPAEEQRLRDADYNLREAYAIYLGLCEWAYCGRPTQSAPVLVSQGGELVLQTTLNEGLPNWWGSDRNRILASTVEVTLDGKRLPIEFDELSRKVTAKLPAGFDAAPGPHVAQIHHENMLGNHNWPQRYQLGADGTPSTALPPIRPRRQPPLRK